MYIPSMTPSHPARRASIGLITKFQCGARGVRGAVFRDTLKTDDRLPLFITDDRKQPITRRRSHGVAPEAAVKRHSIVLSTSRLPVWVSHTCTHACSTESRKICHMGRGRSSFPAQLQVHMEVKHSCMKLIHECTIVHFATADATLIAYLPTHRLHECRCKGPLCQLPRPWLCANGIGNSVKV